jgi:plasmid stabilization system protein ParE
VKPLHVSEPASTELTEAVRWYEDRRPGWGDRLLTAVTATMTLVEAHPEIGSPRRGHPAARQLKVRGFPYLIAYRIRPDDVYVVAVAHAKRRPGYWRHRS